MMLRLTEPWHGTGRAVIGDSWFGGMKGMKAVLDHGLEGTFCVKTQTSQYPMKYMKEKVDPLERGGSIIMTTDTTVGSDEKMPIYAVGWRDLNSKFFLASHGTSLESTPLTRRREQLHVQDDLYWTVPVETYVPRSVLVSNYFDYMNRVDRHDRLRQDLLGLERVWLTKNWEHRLFATLLGICVVDAYLMDNPMNLEDS